MTEQIQSLLSAECPWRDTLYWYNTIDSTNTQAKKLAGQGAPHGTVLMASCQTQGRGRLGRSFHSPADMGIYLSVILRPACKPESLMHLTCAAAVAACQAVKQVSGLQPGIKWINDLVVGNKKLGGILTELSCNPNTGFVDHAIVGIGINCLQSQKDLPPDIRDMATSLLMASGQPVQPTCLAAALIENLANMAHTLFRDKDTIMDIYRKNCITLGKEIQVLSTDTVRCGRAIDIDQNGGLLVAFESGETQCVRSGEVSVRGMYGYI